MEGFYAFDGTNARYEIVAKPEDLAAATKKVGERRTISSLSSYRMLTDGNVTFMDLLTPEDGGKVLHHKATIFRDVVPFNRKFDFPLYIGNKAPQVFDLFSALMEVKDGAASLDQFETNSLLGEIKVSKFTIDYKNARVTYWVDLERGAIPLRILQEPI